ncbi:hypothetical protein HPB47_006204 [Ixodes persulcatus]|uniref:Uncharacterized protein n=1 Tax=Ixodes persulcatus TaxID=34615 RepID=A0AC60PBG6_IXOPE|nr:hypothetical protein HPB47_006204 [Ixodes persulcatus]
MVTMLGKLEEVKVAFCGDNPTTFLNIEDHPPLSIGQKFSHHLWRASTDIRANSIRRIVSPLGTTCPSNQSHVDDRLFQVPSPKRPLRRDTQTTPSER